MLSYLHYRNSKLFFHPAKFDNFQDEKISDYKTCWIENWGDYGQLLRAVLLCFGGQKIYLKKHCSIRTKKSHKIKFKNI